MCTRILRRLTWSAAMLLVLLALLHAARAAAEDAKPGEQPVKLDTPTSPAEADSPAGAGGAPAAAVVEPPSPAVAAGDASDAFQRGVALFKKDLSREALTEFEPCAGARSELRRRENFRRQVQCKAAPRCGRYRSRRRSDVRDTRCREHLGDGGRAADGCGTEEAAHQGIARHGRSLRRGPALGRSA